MTRLPINLADNDAWGALLNAFLLVAHNADGTLSVGTVTATFNQAGTLSVTTGAGRYPLARAGTIVGVVAAVGTAPTGASIICDVKKNGTTVFPTTPANRPTIAAAATVSTVTVPDTTALAARDVLSVDITQIGSTVAGADLTVVVLIT